MADPIDPTTTDPDTEQGGPNGDGPADDTGTNSTTDPGTDPGPTDETDPNTGGDPGETTTQQPPTDPEQQPPSDPEEPPPNDPELPLDTGTGPEDPTPPEWYPEILLTLTTTTTEITSIGQIVDFNATIQNITNNQVYTTTSTVSSSLVGIIASNVDLDNFQTASYDYQYTVTETDLQQSNLVEVVTSTGGSTIASKTISLPNTYTPPQEEVVVLPKPLSFSGPGNITFNGSIKIIK